MSRPAKLSERLARTLCLVVGGLWLSCALGVTWYVHQEISESFDSALVESARRLLDLAAHEIDEIGYVAPVDAKEIPDSVAVKVEDDYLVYQVLDASGRMLLRSANAPKDILPASLAGGFVQQAGWRSFTLQHPAKSIRIVVGDPVNHRQEAVRQTLLGLVLPLLALLPVLVWLTRRIVKTELASLQRFSSELGTRGGRNLEPLEVSGLPQELQPVLANTNHLLLRLDEALKTERALTASAAHELRTPLASARLLLMTAASNDEMPDEARRLLRQATDSLEILSRRAEKVLQLSRAESASALVREPVDLMKLLSAVIAEFGDAAARVDWVATQDRVVNVLADRDSLAIAIRNLIENSLRHAPDSNVQIHVACDGVHARVVVRDDGPGVPAVDLERIRTRHARAGSRASGYGLGLSIVSIIMNRQEGELELRSPTQDSGRGFEAVLRLKQIPA